MNMGIVNAGQLAIYDELPAELREKVEDVILNRSVNGTEALLQFTQRLDGAELTSATLRVGADELHAAHEQADPKFLETIRRIR